MCFTVCNAMLWSRAVQHAQFSVVRAQDSLLRNAELEVCLDIVSPSFPNAWCAHRMHLLLTSTAFPFLNKNTQAWQQGHSVAW